MNNKNFVAPKLASGKVLPDGLEHALFEKEKEEFLRKEQRRHDWLVASFGVIGGGVMGLITSLLFWFITT